MAETLQYFQKLNIPVLNISRIKNTIKYDIKNTLRLWQDKKTVSKQSFRIIGPAGVGKTQICYQIADELSKEIGVPFQLIKITAPVLSRDDMILPFPVLKGDKKYFEMLYSNFVPKDPKSFGIFVIDEFSRGDHALQQLLWQIQNENMLHLFEFPKGWFIISVDNPDDAEYQMNVMEDAAGLRRQLHLYVDVNVKDFLDYAMSHNFHQLVIDFIVAHPDFLYDFKSQKMGMVFANPASYEHLSDHLWKFAIDGIEKNFNQIQDIAGGLLNVNMATMFIDFIKNTSTHISPKDVFENYERVRVRILDMVQKTDNEHLGALMNAFSTYMSTMPKFNDDNLKNICRFMMDNPPDLVAIYFMHVNSFDSKSKEFKYLTDIHCQSCDKIPEYQTQIYERLSKISMGNGKK